MSKTSSREIFVSGEFLERHFSVPFRKEEEENGVLPIIEPIEIVHICQKGGKCKLQKVNFFLRKVKKIFILGKEIDLKKIRIKDNFLIWKKVHPPDKSLIRIEFEPGPFDSLENFKNFLRGRFRKYVKKNFPPHLSLLYEFYYLEHLTPRLIVDELISRYFLQFPFEIPTVEQIEEWLFHCKRRVITALKFAKEKGYLRDASSKRESPSKNKVCPLLIKGGRFTERSFLRPEDLFKVPDQIKERLFALLKERKRIPREESELESEFVCQMCSSKEEYTVLSPTKYEVEKRFRSPFIIVPRIPSPHVYKTPSGETGFYPICIKCHYMIHYLSQLPETAILEWQLESKYVPIFEILNESEFRAFLKEMDDVHPIFKEALMEAFKISKEESERENKEDILFKDFFEGIASI